MPSWSPAPILNSELSSLSAPAARKQSDLQVTLLCIGDVVGRPGRSALSQIVPRLVKEHDVDCVIANVENQTIHLNITQHDSEQMGWEQAPREDELEAGPEGDLHRHV